MLFRIANKNNFASLLMRLVEGGVSSDKNAIVNTLRPVGLFFKPAADKSNRIDRKNRFYEYSGGIGHA